VYLARQLDLARIFDLDRGRFYGLDVIGSRLLTLALEVGTENAAAEAALIYGVAPTLVRGDLESLLAGLRQRHLLECDRSPRPYAGRRIPRWLAGPCLVNEPITKRLAGRLLRRAWWSLRLDGWASTLRRWSRPIGPVRPVSPSKRDEVVTSVDTAIRRAAASGLLHRAVCKERALVGHHLLRVVHGLPASLVVGVQHYPFGVHAWIEVDGRIVTDDPDHCAGFDPVARFA
jgi:hypothetical protein